MRRKRYSHHHHLLPFTISVAYSRYVYIYLVPQSRRDISLYSSHKIKIVYIVVIEVHLSLFVCVCVWVLAAQQGMGYCSLRLRLLHIFCCDKQFTFVLFPLQFLLFQLRLLFIMILLGMVDAEARQMKINLELKY